MSEEAVKYPPVEEKNRKLRFINKNHAVES